jgi:hypothetical protein
MMDLKTASPQEIAKYFSYEVNNMFFKPDKIAEEQNGSRQMEDLDICWIKVISDSGYRTDLRNEASAKTGRQLAEIPFVKRKMESVSNGKMEKVAKEMAIDHRTLQQTFSGLVFFHFLQSCDKEESEELIAVMGESFYRLPLI